MQLKVHVNGKEIMQEVHPGELLIHFLRKNNFFGVKEGCETGECGSCLVIVDGTPRLSCITLAAQVHEQSITTIEGVGTLDNPDPLQTAFIEHGAIQCGYCTPAMILAAKTLLDKSPSPTETEVRNALSGTLCRCTGYKKPVEAILAVTCQKQETTIDTKTGTANG